MHTGKSYKLAEFLVWTRRDIYLLVVLGTVPVLVRGRRSEMAGHSLDGRGAAGNRDGVHRRIQEHADLQPDLGGASDLGRHSGQQQSLGNDESGLHHPENVRVLIYRHSRG